MGDQRAVYLISGPRAAGTPTVARLLAQRFDRGVHLDGEMFRRGVVSGGPAEELEQLRLGCRLGAAAADTCVEAGFAVALEDVVAGPLLGEYRTMIRSRPCHVIVLVPPVDADARFADGTPRVGSWIDTTELTPADTVDEILARTTGIRSPVVVVDYDEQWPALFEQLARPVRSALIGLRAEVEHIGSTSVAGLAAKPVVDIDVVLLSAKDVPAAVERLRSLGYVYQGNKGIEGREAFLWPPGTEPHHLYVVVAGSPPHSAHVRFRDYLREHPEVAREYAALKKSLAEHHGEDRLGYTDAKSDFVAGVLRAADY